METITNNILDDIISVIEPEWIRVKGLFVPRGGTRLSVYAEQYGKNSTADSKELHEFVKEWKNERRNHSTFE